MINSITKKRQKKHDMPPDKSIQQPLLCIPTKITWKSAQSSRFDYRITRNEGKSKTC